MKYSQISLLLYRNLLETNWSLMKARPRVPNFRDSPGGVRIRLAGSSVRLKWPSIEGFTCNCWFPAGPNLSFRQHWPLGHDKLSHFSCKAITLNGQGLFTTLQLSINCKPPQKLFFKMGKVWFWPRFRVGWQLQWRWEVITSRAVYISL